MRLIFIHGRAQEAYEPEDLTVLWTKTLEIGLAKSGLTLPSNVTITFPYYGKLLKELVDESQTAPLVKGDTSRGGVIQPTRMAEIEFSEAFLGEMSNNIAITREEKAELNAIQNVERGIQDNERVHKLLSFLDRRTGFGETAIKNFTFDVYQYLSRGDIRKAINKEVLKSMTNEPCVVVGHSLGSIVSYLILQDNPQFNVKKLITVGSPLGLKAVQKYFSSPLEMPACVINGWFNAYDDRDIVALNPLDRRYFNIKPPIENKSDVNNHTDNNHSIDGYLNDVTIARQIYDALVST